MPLSQLVATDNSQQVAAWRDCVQSTIRQGHELLGGLSDSQFGWRPGSKRWSLAQIFDHINTVNGEILPRMEASIAEARRNGWLSDRLWKPRLMEKLFLYVLNPDTKIVSPVPPAFLPHDSISMDSAAEAFVDTHQRLLALLDGLGGVDVVRIQVVSPVNRRFKFSVACWFEGGILHDTHHLRQARHLRSDPSFPAS